MTVIHNGKRRRANALIEMAFVMIPLTYIAFGTVEFGYFFYIKHTVQGAAREGCRAAIVQNGGDLDVQNQVAGSLFAAGLIPTNTWQAAYDRGYRLRIESPLNTTKAASAVTPGQAVYITLTSPNWGTIGIRASGLIGSGKLITATSVMRKEG